MVQLREASGKRFCDIIEKPHCELLDGWHCGTLVRLDGGTTGKQFSSLGVWSWNGDRELWANES